jgi:1-acyl-sn-glycerol-3-phosphate acyltransferase
MVLMFVKENPMLTPAEILCKILKIVLWLSHRSCAISGNTNLPSGAKIIILNHTDGCDPFFLPLVLDDQPHFLLQVETFNLPVIGTLLKESGQIPVCRGTERAKEAYDQACQMLREGKTVVIFPEGHLVPDGVRVPTKTGAVRMALETGTPIIPMGLYASPENLTPIRIKSEGCFRTGAWQFTGRSYIRFGTAWNPANVFSRTGTPNFRTITDDLMNRVYTLVSEIQKELPCVSHTLLNPILQ